MNNKRRVYVYNGPNPDSRFIHFSIHILYEIIYSNIPQPITHYVNCPSRP